MSSKLFVSQSTMSAKEIAMIALTKALAALPDDDKLDLLERKRFEIARAMKINESKMTNGTHAERIVCKNLGLKWNASEMNGCDGWDSEGLAVEIKSFKNSATRANVNYKFPKRNTKETDNAYAERVYKHYIDTSPGGHYWVMLSHGATQYQQHWFVDNTRFAEAIRTLLLEKPNTDGVNFGCAYCKDCKLPHRLIEISKILNDKDKLARFPQEVKGRCHNQDVQVKY